ncbi:MAG TPA: BON domain-containing protein, partial [Candidatus Angelobacter sp.]
TIPSGTRLVVRTIDPIDSDKNHVGDKFQATLEEAVYVNDVVVAPKGANVYGRLEEVQGAGHIAGKSELKLALTGIVINGQTLALSTSDYDVSGKSRGANTAKKVGGGAAAGAVIGAIVGGGKGAAVGAGVGAGAGTAVQVMTHGEQVHVPSETLLEFTLDQSVTVPQS